MPQKATSALLDDPFTANRPRIYRFLLRLCQDADLASDLTQETLTQGWQRRDQLRNPDALRTWLLRIAHNRFREHIRQRDKTRSHGWEPLSESTLPCSDPLPEKLSADQELGKQIWDAMSELPARQNQVLHLRVVEQLATNEIAEILNINAQAVRSNLAAARKSMRQRLGDAVSTPSSPKAIG